MTRRVQHPGLGFGTVIGPCGCGSRGPTVRCVAVRWDGSPYVGCLDPRDLALTLKPEIVAPVGATGYTPA